MSRRVSTFRPRIEALEDRYCPSGFDPIHVVHREDGGNTLVIRGDDRADELTVQIGAPGHPQYTINFRGETRQILGEEWIDKVVIALGGGDDKVRVATEPLTDNSGRQFYVDAGAGDDQVTFDLRDVGFRDVGLRVRVDGGRGDDRVSFLADRSSFFDDLDFDVDAGAGNDRVSISAWGSLILGRLNARVDCGSGNDRVWFDLEQGAPGTPTYYPATLSGGMDVRVLGGGGDDAFAGRFGLMGLRSEESELRARMGGGDDTVAVEGDAEFTTLNLVLRGGAGKDDVVDHIIR